MLKWASKSSSIDDADVAGNKVIVADTVVDKVSLTSMEVNNKLEEVPLTPPGERLNKSEQDENSANSISCSSNNSLASSSQIQPPNFIPSSPPSLDSGMGGSKTSLSSKSTFGGKGEEEEDSPGKYFEDSNCYSLLWEDQIQVKKEKGRFNCIRRSFFPTIFRFSSFMITIPCILQFPMKVVEHGGGAFILVYSILLFSLIYPCIFLQYNFSRIINKNPITIWSSAVPISGGLGSVYCLISLVSSAKYLVDTAFSAIYLWYSLYVPLPWTQCSSWFGTWENCVEISRIHHSHHVSPMMLKLISARVNSSLEDSSTKFWQNHVKQSDQELNLVLLVSLCTIWSIIFIFVMTFKLEKLKRFQNCFQLIVTCFTFAFLIKILISWDLVMVTNDWSKLSDPATWVSAAVMVTLSTNMASGALMTLSSGDNGRGGYSLDSISILLSVFSHLAMCLIFTLILLSLSQTSRTVNSSLSVLVTVSQSLHTEVVWCQAAFCLVLLLGFASIITTLMPVLTFIQDRFRGNYQRYPPMLCVCLFVILLSLLNVSSRTERFYEELLTWGLHVLSFLIGALTQVTIVWMYGLNTLIDKLASWRGQAVPTHLTVFLQIFGNFSSLHLFVLMFMVIWFNYESNDIAGVIIIVLVLCLIICYGLVITVNGFRRGRKKKVHWKEVILKDIMGKKKEDKRKSLTNSYRKFERCDITLTNLKLSPSQSNSGTLFRRSPKRQAESNI